MKMVISPAKSLNWDKKLPNFTFSKASFLSESNQIQGVLKQKSPQELSDLMNISSKLADLNWQRNQSWKLPFDENEARPAVFSFDGEVYHGLEVYTIPLNKIDCLQDKLRILSGLYGLLKPLDLILPYRLEMGTKISIGDKKDLYAFWKSKITNALNAELEDNDFLINLASTEYFSAVDIKQLKVPVITPEFKDYKDGKLKMISFFAKKARGLMVRFIIDNNIQSVENLKQFDYEGYKFDENLSTKNKLVFTR